MSFGDADGSIPPCGICDDVGAGEFAAVASASASRSSATTSAFVLVAVLACAAGGAVRRAGVVVLGFDAVVLVRGGHPTVVTVRAVRYAEGLSVSRADARLRVARRDAMGECGEKMLELSCGSAG